MEKKTKTFMVGRLAVQLWWKRWTWDGRRWPCHRGRVK